MRTSLLSLALLLAPAAASADLYRYETESGSIAYTDDLKRVPELYRASAVREPEQKFTDYNRLSIVSPDAHPSAPVSYTNPFEADHETRQPARSPVSIVTIKAAPDVFVDSDPYSDEPVKVKRHEYRWVDGEWQPFTIVSQGGRVLATIEEK